MLNECGFSQKDLKKLIFWPGSNKNSTKVMIVGLASEMLGVKFAA
jgi:hypothetical protein